MKKESEEYYEKVVFRKGSYSIYHDSNQKILLVLSLDAFLTWRLGFDGTKVTMF